jgi:hypothetical protein
MKKILALFIALCINLSITALAETVVYNTKTGKIHATWCSAAKRCTVNCVKIEKKEAIKRGGKPCKICGG